MDELSLFTQALGLAKPWNVVEVVFSKDTGRLDLQIDFPRGATFLCPTCGKGDCPVHDTKERTWRHLNFFQYETYIHARVPRTDCATCGVVQVEVPWARPGSGFTLLFEMLVLQFSREMSVDAVAKTVHTGANRIWRILQRYVDRARRKVDLSGFHVLGIDEFSVRKGHDYMTAFSDIDAARIVHVAETREHTAIREFTDEMKSRGYPLADIRLVCCDMWDPYLLGLSRYLPHTNVVFDRFHIMKKMNAAVDDVRRQEQKQVPGLKRSRFIWLKNPCNLTDRQSAVLMNLKKLDLKTARAYQLKLALARFWEITSLPEATRYLRKWCSWALRSRLPQVIMMARTIRSRWQGVINYTLARISNGVVEGLNSKIKTAMKRAYGFKSPSYLKTIVYLVAGKLCFD
jgi:transposase